MGDPLWSDRFQPVFSEAIPLLASLLGRELIDRLLAKQLITGSQHDDLVAALERQPKAETARELYRILRHKPTPSFTTFFDVLLEVGGEAGHHLKHLLSGTSSSGASLEPLVSVHISQECQKVIQSQTFVKAFERQFTSSCSKSTGENQHELCIKDAGIPSGS